MEGCPVNQERRQRQKALQYQKKLKIELSECHVNLEKQIKLCSSLQRWVEVNIK